jgi:GAF domain-containing protein
MRMRRSLRFHLFGSALILVIPASYSLVAGLSHQIWSQSAAIGYLFIGIAGLATGIPIAYQAHAVLTRSLQNVGVALGELGRGRAARVNPAGLPAELRELAQALNAASDILTARQHQLSEQSRRAALLTRLAIDLHASDDPPTIAHDILRLISLRIDACDAAIVVVGPDGAIELAYTTAAGAPRPMPPEQARRELEHGPAGWVVRHSDSVLLRNDISEGREDRDGRAGPAGSAIALPLTHGQAIFGVLTIRHPRPGHFTSQDLLLFEAVAAQASVALAAARLRLEERRRRDQALLLSIGQSPNAERSPERLATDLLDRATAAFDAGAAAIFLACQESTGLSCFASHTAPLAEQNALAGQLPAHMAAAAERAWQTGVPTSELAPDGAKLDQENGGLACLALPLRHGGEAIGALALARRARGAAMY